MNREFLEALQLAEREAIERQIHADSVLEGPQQGGTAGDIRVAQWQVHKELESDHVRLLGQLVDLYWVHHNGKAKS